MSTPGQPASAKQTVKIVSLVNIPATDPKRLGKSDTIVTYQVDSLNVFQVTLPTEQATEAGVISAVKADFAQKSKIIGRTIEVG